MTMSTPYNNEERRFALRMSLRLPIVISGRTEDGSAWSEPTETDDISTSGALFHLNQKVTRGERLYLRAHRPDGTPIEENHVYVPPPQVVVTMVDGRLGVEMPREGDRVYHPIDGFFDSLGRARREQAIGIVLSGTGSDGALGLKAIKECGGLTIAQGRNGTAPQEEEMPAGAIATGAVDLIVPVEEIPSHLLRLKNARTELPQEGDAASEFFDK